jgi:superfamily II DNA or RNA helicase
MISFQVYEARTFFDGPDAELEVMYRRLRVKDKNAIFRAKQLITSYGPKGLGKWTIQHLAELVNEDLSTADLQKKIIQKLKVQIEEKEINNDDIDRLVDLCLSAKYIRFYDGRNDSFGTGLLGRVKKYLRRKCIGFSVEDHRVPLPNLLTEGEAKFSFQDEFENRDEQYAVIKAACTKGCGILHCATNFGKTDVAAAIAKVWHEKFSKWPSVLFLIHRKNLVFQTQKRFEKHLGIKVGLVGDGRYGVQPITISTTQTASNLVEEKNQKFREYLEANDIIFLDEVHVNKAKQAQRVMNHCKARMRFALSGTVSRLKSKLLPLMAMTGPIIAEIRNKELVDLGRSAKPFVRMVHVDAKKRVEGSFGHCYNFGIVRHKFRNGLVIEETQQYVRKNLRTFITVWRLRHGRILRRRLMEAGLSVELMTGHTPISERDRLKADFVNRKFHVLIVSPIFDVGEDLPEIDAWVNAAAGKGWELVLQRLGRILRKKQGDNRVYFSDFLDEHCQYLDDHAKQRLEYYENEKMCSIKIV